MLNKEEAKLKWHQDALWRFMPQGSRGGSSCTYTSITLETNEKHACFEFFSPFRCLERSVTRIGLLNQGSKVQDTHWSLPKRIPCKICSGGSQTMKPISCWNSLKGSMDLWGIRKIRVSLILSSASLSVCLGLSVFACLSVSVCICLSSYLSLSLCMCLSVCLSVCLSSLTPPIHCLATPCFYVSLCVFCCLPARLVSFSPCLFASLSACVCLCVCLVQQLHRFDSFVINKNC